jgi:hypothetical protein
MENHIKARNKNILEAYNAIIMTIDRIQGWLKDEELRTRIESDYTLESLARSTYYQCTTPFCVVSLGCDEMGRYNIIYSVDYRFKEMISDLFASTLIRRIYEFTPGEMEPFVRIGSLYLDCVKVYTQVSEESKIKQYHKVIIRKPHDLSSD